MKLGMFQVCLFGVLISATFASADDWPQWRGMHRDGEWREEGIVEQLPAKLNFKWKKKIGAGYSGPAVADGKVFVTDRQLGKDQQNPDDPFSKAPVGGSERILCLDAKTGDILWKHEYPCQYTISYPAGPRATPTIHEGKVYSVGAMGNFFCLDAKTGNILWSKDYVKDFGTEINTWGMSSAPLVDGENVILITGGSEDRNVVALNKETGEMVWHALNASDPGYTAPVIFEAGGVRQLIVWDPVALYSLDPATGKTYWKQDFPVKFGMTIPTPIFDPTKNLLFVTAFYDGPMMMKLAKDKPTAEVSWKGKSTSEIKTDGLHAVMCTPVFQGGYIYGVCSYGQLRCLEEETGKRVWETFGATGEGRWWNAFITRHQDRYFINNEQGDLIVAKLSPEGYKEESRAFLIAPTNRAARREIVWSHPAYANKCVYARNDEEIVCADLSR